MKYVRCIIGICKRFSSVAEAADMIKGGSMSKFCPITNRQAYILQSTDRDLNLFFSIIEILPVSFLLLLLHLKPKNTGIIVINMYFKTAFFRWSANSKVTSSWIHQYWDQLPNGDLSLS